MDFKREHKKNMFVNNIKSKSTDGKKAPPIKHKMSAYDQVVEIVSNDGFQVKNAEQQQDTKKTSIYCNLNKYITIILLIYRQTIK